MQNVGRLVLYFVVALIFKVVAEPTAKPEVLEVRGAVLLKTILPSDDAWVLGVGLGWKCKSCRRIRKFLERLSVSPLKDAFRFAVGNGKEYVEGLDGDDLMLKDQMGIKAFPGIILFPFGPKQIKAAIILDSNIAESMIDGEDGRRKAQKMLKNFLPSLVKSTATNAELNVFLHGSDHQLRRILLLTKLSKPSQMYKKLSLQFDRRFVFGISDSEDLARRFGIHPNERPQLVVSPDNGGKKLKKCTRKTTFHWDRFEYELEETKKLNAYTVGMHLNRLKPTVSVPYVGNQSAWNKNCLNPRLAKICVIGLLQFGNQAGGQEVEAIEELATKSILRTEFGDGRPGSVQVQRMPLSLMWMHGELQNNFLDLLKVSRLPALVVLNPLKRQYSLFYGSIPLQSSILREYILATLSGAVKLIRLNPNIDLSNVIADSQYLEDEDTFQVLENVH